MAYLLKLTAAGAAKLTAANAGGPAVSLTHIAIGDGNGNPVAEPTGNETALVHEIAGQRRQINALYVSPTDSTVMMAEMVIPADQGGFAVHEIGIFDAEGGLFAYGNFPATYKPLASEGSTRDMIIEAAMKVSNSAVIQLVIDASIVIATRPWVLATMTTAFLIPGGTTGQILAKASNADGDFEWVDITDTFNIAVDVVKESHTATEGQTVFTLTTLTTDGVAVYVEGGREFDFTVLNETQVQLSAGLPAGVKVWFVQNEPNEPLKLRRLVIGRALYLSGN